MSRGKYICLEGGDGTGKSTLAAALYGRLSPGVWPVRFPSDGDVGTLIRRGLTGDVDLSSKAYLYLFAADGINEESKIQTMLNGGNHVICDRHPTLSGRVFQPLHHSEEQIESVYGSAAEDGISMPDDLFVLHVPISVARERMKSRDKYKDVVFEKDDEDYMGLLNERYREIAMKFDGHMLDATRPVEELVGQILKKTGLL